MPTFVCQVVCLYKQIFAIETVLPTEECAGRA